MRAFEASFETVILRFFLMMTVIIVAFVAGAAYLALIAVPIFISAMMAVKFDIFAKTVKKEALQRNLNAYPNLQSKDKRIVA